MSIKKDIKDQSGTEDRYLAAIRALTKAEKILMIAFDHGEISTDVLSQVAEAKQAVIVQFGVANRQFMAEFKVDIGPDFTEGRQ